MAGNNFGSGFYGSGVYGGQPSAQQLSAIPIAVDLFDNTGAKKAVYQTGSGDFLGCEFSFNESGPEGFTLFFAQSVEITKQDIIKITLFNSDDYFFTGVVRAIPIDGSTEARYDYSGFGFIDYIARVNAESKAYVSKTLDFIINDLVDDLVGKTPITKNTGKIIPPNITMATFDINYTQMTAAMESLKNVAASDGNQYVVGVDNVGDFYFRPRDTETKVTLVVGKKGNRGIDSYEPKDSEEPRSKYFVLDKDGIYVTTISTTEVIDIFEEKLTAPDIDNASIAKWAQGILTETEIETRRASIIWKIEESDPLLLVADGNIRVISNIPSETAAAPSPNPFGSGTFGSGLFGGGQYTGKEIDDTLRAIHVNYVINGGESVRNIELGSLAVNTEEAVNEVRKNLTDLRVSLGR